MVAPARFTISLDFTYDNLTGGSLHIKANDMGIGDSVLMVDKLIEALKAEKAEMHRCPAHRVKDMDLVCTACRRRGGHASDCDRRDEPWPTIAKV